MAHAYRSLAPLRQLLLARGWRTHALGAVDFSDQCLTEEALKGTTYPKWCQCYLYYGGDVEGAGGFTPYWRDVIAAAAQSRFALPTVPADGPAPWGHVLEGFDWTGARAKAWLTPFAGLASCGDRNDPIADVAAMTDDSGCCTVSPYAEGRENKSENKSDGPWSVWLNNGCVHDGAPNTQTHFGGPVLEFFNFSRLLRILKQWPTMASLPSSYAANFQVDSTIAPGMRRAYDNLFEFLGRSWPRNVTAFDQAAHERAKARLLNPDRRYLRAETRALLGDPPYNFAAWFNRLRYEVQRLPGSDAWHCLWQTPLLTDVDTPFNPQDPWSTGKVPLLYKHEPTFRITAGDQLARILDFLAPGWQVKRVPSLARPSPAAIATGAVAAAGIGAAFVWWLL